MAAELERILTKTKGTIDIATQISKIVQEIRFGSIAIIVHENRVVQLERKNDTL